MAINVAVVGFGMSATVFHIPFLLSSPSFTLTTIVERSATSTSSKARDAFPNIKVVNTLEQALEDDQLDAVWILTINDTHFDYVKQCLQAGKHVVVEKPITPTSQQAQELAQLAKEKNLVLAVYQVNSCSHSLCGYFDDADLKDRNGSHFGRIVDGMQIS